ncbi:MAG: glycogen synthase GlgA [Elusimicrobia bacterium]|nr:glycogen synthase GlgA [Elusimicrobiota bacterium]
MKILQVASEAVPFCKTGGLADVVGALSQRLGLEGHDVCLFLPRYRCVESTMSAAGMARPITITVGGQPVVVRLRYAQWKAVSVYFIDHPESFDREGLYGGDGKDYPDNDRRFVTFCRAVLESIKVLGFKPEVIHLHDWQAALIAAYLRRLYREDPSLGQASTVLTIHNLAYQGVFPRESFSLTGFAESDFTAGLMEYYGNFGFLKTGLTHADAITTVSPTYAREIQTAERGFGLEGILASRASDLCGVLNGVDYEVWNPQTDQHLAKRYSASNVAQGKAACKAELSRLCGFEDRPETPLIGIVSRLDRQKGLDIAAAALKSRLDRAKVVVQGVGDAELAGLLSKFAQDHPKSVFFRPEFDEPLVRKIYAGADIFLMPSRFEPCGLGQMIAMRYGAVPVVSRTGGLADTVFEGDPPAADAFPKGAGDARPPASTAPSANGFLAGPEDADDLGQAIDRALAAYAVPESWRARVLAGMGCDCSWDRSASIYADLYRRSRRLR